jgi:ABC-type sulfate transport system permease component
MINLLRYGFTGALEYSVQTSMLVLCGCTLVSGLLSYYLLKTGYKLQS